MHTWIHLISIRRGIHMRIVVWWIVFQCIVVCCVNIYMISACEQGLTSICTWVMSDMNQSCLTYKWVVSHMWMSHATHMNEPCQIYTRAMSPWHTCECDRVHVWMSHGTHTIQSWAEKGVREHILQQTAAHYNTLHKQHAAHLQHTATHCNRGVFENTHSD